MATLMPSITISFIQLLKTICDRLGLPEPIYNCADATQKIASVAVPRPDKSKAFYYHGDQADTIEDSCQSAAQKLVLFLVRKYKILVHDCNLGIRGNIERAIQLYKLSTADLNSSEKELPASSLRACDPIEGLNYSNFNVTIDFKEILKSVVQRFQISITPIETVEVDGGTYRSWFSVPRSGSSSDYISMVGISFETAEAAKQDLCRRAVTHFMHEYQFDIKDVNYFLLDGCKLALKYERESYIATKERVYGYIEDSTPIPKVIDQQLGVENGSISEATERSEPVQPLRKKRRLSKGRTSNKVATCKDKCTELLLTLKNP